MLKVRYKAIILIIVAFLMMSCQKSPLHKEIIFTKIKGYTLVWHDEFNKGSIPDSSKWSYEKGFVRNKELQWYQPANTYVQNGFLILEGRREQLKNPYYDSTSSAWKKKRRYVNYTSACLTTKWKYSFKYGILIVRARIDTSKGMWPAIWTLVADIPRSAHIWKTDYGEVDIMEFYRYHRKPTILANVAWSGNYDKLIWNSKKVPLTFFLKKDPHWSQKFHIWKMKWTPKYIKISLDEGLINKIDLSKTRDPDGFNPFHQSHYILLNLAIGANGGDPSHTMFPKRYKVDYVRVYQKK
jgi:beta-glucanase (GH16 family)